MPRNNLPPASVPWGSDVERRLSALETTSKNLDTLVSSNNARLTSLLAAQQAAATIQAGLVATQADLVSAQAAIIENQDQLSAQVTFLATSTISAEAAPGSTTDITVDPATSDVPETWVDFDADADASVTLTTSSTGKVSVQAGGYMWLASNFFCDTTGFIGVEVLDEIGSQVFPPNAGDGNLFSVWGDNNANTTASSGHRHIWTFNPNTTYTFRCRRGYMVYAGSAGAYALISFQGTAISISKVGM